MYQCIFVLGVLLLNPLPHNPSGGPGDETSKQNLQLKIGEQGKADPDTAVTFLRVVNDSRCPKGAHCFWEGEAVVELTVTAAGQTKDIQLSTYGRPRPGSGLPSAVKVGEALISLESLDPHPVNGEPLPDSKSYRLVVSIGE